MKGDGTMFTKIVAGVLLITLLSFPISRPSYADVNGWEAAGLVLAGAIGYAILDDIAESNRRPRYYVGVPVYERRHSTVRVYHTRYTPRREWIPGHYGTRTQKVWVSGCYEKIWVSPVTRRVWVRDRWDGHWEEEIIRRGRYKKVWREGYYEYREAEVWVEGRWVCS